MISSCSTDNESSIFQLLVHNPHSEPQLLISEKHLKHYSFVDQKIFLNKAGVDQIMDISIDEGCTFQVIFNGDTIGYGNCVNAVLSSFPTGKPVIYFGTHQRVRLGDLNSFKIYCFDCKEGFAGLNSKFLEDYFDGELRNDE